MKGMLIVVDGLDLAGKTTHVIPHLKKRLSEVTEVVQLHTIYDSEHGDTIGKMIATRDDLDEGVAALLFAALRLDVMRQRVIPAIEQGKVVLIDRFNLSTEVYQKGCGFVQTLIPIMTGGVNPDCTIFCDISTQTYIDRLHNLDRTIASDDRERALLGTFSDKRASYLEAIKGAHHGVVHSLDCNGTPFNIHEKLDPIIDNLIRAYNSLNTGR